MVILGTAGDLIVADLLSCKIDTFQLQSTGFPQVHLIFPV